MLSRQELERRVQLLERALGGMPLWVPAPTRLTPPVRLKITGGKDLTYGGLEGVKYTSASVASVPTLLDVDAPADTAEDGFGWATNIFTDEKVLVCTARVVVGGIYIGGGVLSFDLPNDTEVLAWRTFRVPVVAGGTMPVYDLWFLG